MEGGRSTIGFVRQHMSSEMQFPPLGRQPGTWDTYSRQGARIARSLSAEIGSTDSSLIVAAFLARGGRYSQRTFRLYKACLLQHLGSQGAPPSVVRLLNEASSKDCIKKGGAKTSGQKSKKVSATDRALLLDALRSSGSRSATLAADYFEAGLILGPRPIEWVGSAFEVLSKLPPLDAPAGATHLVHFRNAKRDMNAVRGNGDVRSLYVSLNSAEAALLARVIQDANSNASTWPKHYNNLRAALRYAGRKLWPRRTSVPCFYTTRHQSQADAKASGKRLNEIAAMFGHASDNTSTQHYARATQGDKNMCKVAPTALSLARVRNQATTEHMLLRSNGKNFEQK